MFSRGLSSARKLTEEELIKELAGSKPIFYDINRKIVFPAAAYLHDSLAPKVYKEFEVIISKFRINVLKVERLLLRLTHYIRGKREVRKNSGHHPYWTSVKTSGMETNNEQEKSAADSSDKDKTLRI